MHNNRAYRMVLNSMTWGAISWSQLLLASSYNHARNNYHFLNYVDDCTATLRGVARTEEQKTRTYVFNRASTFFNEFYNDNDYIGMNINTIHFINEVMFEMWRVIDNNGNSSGRPSSFISHYTSNQEAINYENEFEKILDAVKGTYNARKTALLDELAKASEKLKAIFAMRDNCTRTLMDPFVQMKTFSDKIETLTEDKNAKFIREFLGDSTKFDIMKKLHVIVAFYLELHRIFDYKLTEDEVDSVTIGDVIKGTEKYHSELLQKLWPDFKDVWRKVTDVVRPRECVNAGDYEGELALIDDNNTPIMRVLLSFYQEDGEIYRAVADGISKLQDGVLDMRNADLNPEELGYDDTESDLPLESLTENDMSHLITGENYSGELELIIFTHMRTDSGLRRDSVTYDYAGIARDIMCKYTSGRPHLRTGNEMTFRRECNFLCDDLEPAPADESEEQKIEKKRGALIDSFRPLHGVESLRAYVDKARANARKLRDFESKNTACDREIEKIVADKKTSSESIEVQCVRIADVLASVLRFVVSISNNQNKLEAASRKTIGDLFENDVCGEEIPGELSFMKGWPGKSLLFVSEKILNVMNEKRYLFRDVKSNYIKPIESKKDKDRLDSYRSSLLWSDKDTEEVAAKKKAEAPAKVRLLESLFQALNSNRHLLKDENTSLKETFKCVITGMFQSDKEEEVELLKSTKARCFADFMTWLQKLISDAHWEMAKEAGKTREYEAGGESEKERRERNRVTYKEFIPPKPTILKDLYHRFEVPYNEKLAKYIPMFGYKVGEVVIVNPKTKEEVTEEERARNYEKHDVLLVKKKTN